MVRGGTALLLLAAVAAADPLVVRAGKAVAKIKARRLVAGKHTPWVVMHAVIAFEKGARIHEPRAKRDARAIDFLLERAEYGGKRIVREIDGAPALPTRPLLPPRKVQDHVDQYLMAFADAGVKIDARIVADTGRAFALRDLLAAAQRGFREDQELGWTLVAFAEYVGFHHGWEDATGKRRFVQDLVALAVTRDPKRETEGGTHHLYGVAYALRAYRRAFPDLELAGPWLEARDYLARYVRLAKRHQRRDGAFSATLFRGSTEPKSPARLVWSTGHMLEWLALACDRDALRADWVRRAVARLCQAIEDTRLAALGDGGTYHAAHALRLWGRALSTAPAAR